MITISAPSFVRRLTATLWLAQVRYWWRSRPTVAGIALAAAGIVLIWPPYATLSVGQITIAVQTLSGAASLVLGVAAFGCAAVLWSSPPPRVRAVIAVVAWVVAWAAIAVANLGVFGVATGFAVFGAAGSMAWTERVPTSEDAEVAPSPTPARMSGHR